MKLARFSARREERGVAVVVVLALLAILMLYGAANLKSLRLLSQEVKLVEQHQLRRWNATPISSNSPPATANITRTPREPD